MSSLSSLTTLTSQAQSGAGAIDNDKLREAFSKSVGEVFHTRAPAESYLRITP